MKKENRRNPYASFLESVEKPARYIGGEKYVVQKEWIPTRAKVALCFPDTYEIGMSHLGYKILYDQLNLQEGILAERVYTPWIDMEKVMRENNLPLVSLESFSPLKDFQILGFSLQYEMSYTNILTMLDLGGVPLWQKERREEDPFVIVGGPCATHPEPLAPFIDFAVVGDGEDIFARLALFVGKERNAGTLRGEILKQLAGWNGIYVPSLYSTEIDELTELEVVKEPIVAGLPKKILRHFVEDINKYPFPTSGPIPHANAIFDNFSVELARGCTEGCRFCQAGMIYRPVRERRPVDVVNHIMDGMKKGGFDEASLTCLSTADYSAVTPLILELIDKMKEEDATLGIASLRAYGLDKVVFDKMAEVQNSSLTFAPEAGSDRMRKVINKNISEKDMLQTAEDVFSRGWQKMKLYFMIGLPTETDEDVMGIMETAKRAKDIGHKCGVNPKITVSVSSFVPKPHTPFQWVSMISLSEIERKQEFLWKMSKNFRLNFRKHDSKISYMEGIVSRGDRRISAVIYDAWKAGARFDGWNETFDFNIWLEAIEKNNIVVKNYLGTLRMDGRLPWSHIDVGLEDKFLEREWIKALKDRLSPPCGKPAGAIVHHSNLTSLIQTHETEKKKLVCYHCGIKCDLTAMVDERKDFLQSMNAVEDKPYVRPEKIGNNFLKNKNKHKREVTGDYRYRISFSKVGAISFISHLELQKVISRIFKRAGVRVLYSQGYNARPLISFGPALSLGVSSLAEFFDVRTEEKYDDGEELKRLLQESSETGIVFNRIDEITREAKSIQDTVKKFYFYFPLEGESENKLVDEEIEGNIKHLLNEENITLDVYSKKSLGLVKVNIRSRLSNVERSTLNINSEMVDLIDEVSPCRHTAGLMVTTHVDQGSTIKPQDLAKCMKMFGLNVGKPIKIAADF